MSLKVPELSTVSLPPCFSWLGAVRWDYFLYYTNFVVPGNCTGSAYFSVSECDGWNRAEYEENEREFVSGAEERPRLHHIATGGFLDNRIIIILLLNQWFNFLAQIVDCFGKSRDGVSETEVGEDVEQTSPRLLVSGYDYDDAAAGARSRTDSWLMLCSTLINIGIERTNERRYRREIVEGDREYLDMTTKRGDCDHDYYCCVDGDDDNGPRVS